MATPHTPILNSRKAKYVHRLDTAGGVRKELAALYAEARRGTVDTTDAYRLSLILGQLVKALETSELADRLATLEAAAAKTPRHLRRMA